MKKIALSFEDDTDIISVPDEIALNIKKHQHAFDKWIYNKDIDHEYWVKIDGRKMAVSFDTDAFVKYLNDFPLKSSEEKASVLEYNVESFDKDIPKLYF
jgi:hypothetical protein